MNSVLEEIYATGRVRDAADNTHELHSHMSRDEGAAITRLLRAHDISRVVEVGLAYGLSALHIGEALADTEAPRHVAIDPYQSRDWHGIGASNLERAGYTHVETIEQPSELALPQLLADGATFQFGLVDGLHTFDQTLLDLYYVNRLLEVGGLLVVDDLWMPGVNKAVRSVLTYPAYEVVEVDLPPRTPSRSRRMLNLLGRALPRSLSGRVFDDSLLRPDDDLGIAGSMAVLKKTAEDERSWDWFRPF